MVHEFATGKLQVVAGLRWEIVQQSRPRALRVLARSENAAGFACKAGKYGTLLGMITTINEKTSFSLALLLLPVLRQRGENVIAVFACGDDEYCFIALVNNDLAVLSDVTGNLNTVQAAIDIFRRFNESAFVCIAPPGVLPEEAEELTLAEALQTTTLLQRWNARLQPVSSQKMNTRIALVAGICAATWLGWQYWQDSQQRERDEQARQAYLISKKAKMPPVIRPWEKKPLPAMFLRQCRDVWKPLPLSIAGWRFQSAECGTDSSGQNILMVRYQRGPTGAVGDFAARLPLFFQVIPTFDIPGTASVGQFLLPVSMTSQRADSETLLPAHQALVSLTTYIQHLQATLTIQKQSMEAKAAGAALPWQLYRFTVKTDIPPEHLFPQPLPGVRLTKITLNLSQARLHYAISGEMYVR